MEPDAIIEVMGGVTAVDAPGRSYAALRDTIGRGLNLATLHNTLEHVYPDPARRKRLLHRLIPQGSYKRRARTGRLTPAESERVARLANIVAFAEYVWRDRDAAREFLTTPHPELDDQVPIEVALDEFGARQVEQILYSILHGLPA